MNVQHDSRLHAGLQEVFKSVFPIDDFAGRGRLEFVYYELEEPKYDVEECIQRGMTYAAPLKVILRLIVWYVGRSSSRTFGARPSLPVARRRLVDGLDPGPGGLLP
jgi:DNA-directed RNA polymerase beta subunit